MKTLLLLLFTFCLISQSKAQQLNGAWESTTTNASGTSLKTVAIVTDGYNVLTTYETETGKFISTMGGSWKMNNGQLLETIEFHTEIPSLVGQQQSLDITFKEESMEIPALGMTFTRIDGGTPGKLNGPWLMSGRVRDGETQSRDTTGPRKTMKILSGTRFQWIAYNTETKEFMGTGGGTYSTVDGKYTENIEFFSKDDSRVGASLGFDYDLKNGDWHHSGLSSKGDPIYEIWSLRK